MPEEPQAHTESGVRGQHNQCTARTKRTGERCKGWAIAGGHVCRLHGGSAPQVKASAQLRLAALIDPAINVIANYLKNTKSTAKDETKLRAALAILDRTGYHPGQDLHLSGTVETLGNASALDMLPSRLARLAERRREGGNTPGADGTTGA